MQTDRETDRERKMEIVWKKKDGDTDAKPREGNIKIDWKRGIERQREKQREEGKEKKRWREAVTSIDTWRGK